MMLRLAKKHDGNYCSDSDTGNNAIVTHMKFRVVSGNFTVLSYIGQSDLHITYFGSLQVWYTLGVACVGYVT